MTTINVPAGFIIAINQSGDGTISYSGAVEGTISSWPVTLVNSDPSSGLYIKVYFSTNINLTGGTDRYFICGSEYIQIGNDLLNTDGTQTVITINGITDYPGLVKNGDNSVNGYDNITIKNIGVVTTNDSTLVITGGWIGQSFFSRGAANNQIINCYSTGDISEISGGITGYLSGYLGGNIIIRNCYSRGNIGPGAGGIFGSESGNNGFASAIYCFSTGTIGSSGGGIFGDSARLTVANNCYSTGSIGIGAGGIYGNAAGVFNLVLALNCYSLGQIGQDGGGIFGKNATDDGLRGGQVNATNCYSTGSIGLNAGAIFGSSTNFNPDAPATNAIATNCYWVANGPAAGPNSIITTTSSGNGNGSWSDTTAALYLTGVPAISDVGATWARTDGLNTPFKLRAIGFSPYSRSLITTFNTTVQAPGETPAAIVAGHTFQILAINGSSPASYPGITINSSTGVITISSTVTADTYSIVVYDYINPYAITTVEVEVNGQTIVIPSYCCPVTTNANFPVYEIKNNITNYKGMNYDAHNNGKKIFNSYSDYIKYKMARNYICN